MKRYETGVVLGPVGWLLLALVVFAVAIWWRSRYGTGGAA